MDGNAYFYSIKQSLIVCVLKVKSFVGEHGDEVVMAIKQEAEQIVERNIAWMRRSRDDIFTWLIRRQMTD